jgi:hypothetical protein
MQQLQDLMSLDANTELIFDDGSLLANSTVLSLFSRVLRGAISSSSNKKIRMGGVTKAEWLAVAPFWHPVEPSAAVQSWEELDLVLRIGSHCDLRPVLDRAGDFLAVNAEQLTMPCYCCGDGEMCVWRWLRLADALRLTGSMATLVKRAVQIDRDGCSKPDNIKGLTAGTLEQLVTVLTPSSSEQPKGHPVIVCSGCRAQGKSAIDCMLQGFNLTST